MASERPEPRVISRRRFLGDATAAAAFAVTAVSPVASLALGRAHTSGRSETAVGFAPAADMAMLAPLLAHIKFGDSAARLVAVKHAPYYGTQAIIPLGKVAAGTDAAAARAAVEAIKRIVRNAGRPGAEAEAGSSSKQLLELASAAYPRPVRGEALELLGSVASAGDVDALAALLEDPAVGEDVRLALQRVPGREADAALRAAARSARGDRRAAIELSIRHRRLKRSDLGTKR